MPTDTTTSQLVINKLTKQQYEDIQNPSPTELYLVQEEEELDPHRIIEFQVPTAENNYTWYRKYADGWVEQGGRTSNFTNTTVSSQNKEESLLIEMAGIEYSVSVHLSYDLTLGNGSTAGWGYRSLLGEPLTTTTIQVRQYLSTNGSGTSCIAIWEVKGMYATE